MIYRVTHHCNASNRSLPCRAECKERRSLHLDCKNSGMCPFLELLFGFPVWGICCPDAANPDRPSGGGQLSLKNGDDLRSTLDRAARRQIVIGSSLISNGTRSYHQTWNRQVRGDAARRG